MYKTAHSIYLDYKKSIKDAEQIERVAKRIMKESSNIMDCHSAVDSAWKGENADILKRKLLKLDAKLNSISKQLEKSAKIVRTIAETTYRSEQAALDLAKKRKV